MNPTDTGASADTQALRHDAEAYFDRIVQGVAASLLTRLEASPGDVIGSYRVIRPLGQGGMGRVYLAERIDGEIEQTVAIKLLRADAHSAAWRERFLRERQLLATLRHPVIVRLLDAGHTPDGRPFLVMEPVDGLPIDAFAAGIGIKEQLRLFVRVCDGVSYAHRQLIVHRDLKPSNILVEAGGRPKLLDFGIAKLLDETGEVTQLAEQLLTPDYASPEQLRGESQSIATDIYSLGAVLYKMLTGATPRERAPVIGKDEITPPSRVNSQIPSDLDSVLNKALRCEPEHRYGSVEEFASDIQAVLKRQPVQARNGDFWYRTRRYLSRHWLTWAAVLVVLVSLSTGLWIANRERAISEKRFTDVRQLATKLFDIDAQVAQLPGSSKTRQLIVDTALQYLRHVSADASADPALALELGTAYMRVARVQGVNIAPNLGETAAAERSEQQAQGLIEFVLSRQPGNRTAMLRAAQIAHDRMILAGDASRSGEVLSFARTAAQRIDQYLRAGPSFESLDRQDAQQAIITLINVSNQYMKAAQFEEALGVANRAIEIARATNWPGQEGAALMVEAQVYRARGDLNEALGAIRASVKLLRPDDSDRGGGRLKTYGLALIREGEILGEDEAISLNRTEDAVKSIERALEIAEEFARRDPNDFQSHYRAFTAEMRLADILRHSDPGRALELYSDALRHVERAAAHGSAIRNQTEALAKSIDPLLRLSRRADAHKRLEEALAGLEKLKQYPASRVELGSVADVVLRAEAEYELAVGNATRGAEAYEQLLSFVYAASPTPETKLEHAVLLSNLYRAAAHAYRKAGRGAEASNLDERRLQLWRHWDSELPNNEFISRQIEAARRR